MVPSNSAITFGTARSLSPGTSSLCRSVKEEVMQAAVLIEYEYRFAMYNWPHEKGLSTVYLTRRPIEALLSLPIPLPVFVVGVDNITYYLL